MLAIFRIFFTITILFLIVSCSSDDSTIEIDTTLPTTPTSLQASNIGQQSVELSWTPSTDANGISRYEIYINGILSTNSSNSSATIQNLMAATNHTSYVVAVDNSGLKSANSNTVSFTTLDNCNTSGTLFPNESGQQLLQSIKGCFTPTTTFSYGDARDLMYSDIDIWDDGLIHTIYTDYTISVDVNNNPRSEALNKGVNTEHVFPRSMGAENTPALSDIHHIFPAREDVNGYRSNKAFDEIDDTIVDRWYYLDQLSTTIPSSGIDNFSEGTTTKLEPREEIKGDVARAVFYFYTIHNNVANTSFFNSMVDELLIWNEQDPVSTRERQRNDKIKAVQGNDNPFIVQPELAKRIFE